MLYGMNDDDYNNKEKYSLIKKEEVNIKKIALLLSSLIIAFLIIFVSFLVSYQSFNKNEENLQEEIAQNPENVIEDRAIENNVQEKTENLKKKEDDGTYNGNHMLIATHDTEKIEKKFVPQQNPNAQELIKNIYYSDEKQVYLTFDDGPSKDITPQILDILKQNDIKATFFVLGARVKLYPETLKREFEEGHYIANHGYSHDYKQIYQSKDTVFQEYVDCENAIKTALNNQDYNSYLFRFPGGSSGGKYSKIKSEAKDFMSSYGVAHTNWNCLTGDAEGKKTKEDCIAELIHTKGNQNSLIVLMHDANDKTQTLEALPEIIQYFKNEGYTFKNFYEIFN